jgi:hypothetical protein
MKTRKSVMYVYHEETARKGGNEVCSFLHACIHETKCASMHEGIVFIFRWMCGENKNHTIHLYMALVDTGMFDNVQQFFPVRGHSCNICDRNFGQIQSVLRRVDCVYSMKEYVEFIVNAAKCNRFSVYLVSTEDVLNFTAWWPKYY